MIEQWSSVAIPGYEELYRVSNTGKVWSNRRKTLLRLSENKEGYLSVTLASDTVRTYASVHRLVARSFVPGYGEKLQVNHINRDKSDNTSTNLEWVTMQYNIEYGNGRYWQIVCPDNTTITVFNLARFSREEGLSSSAMGKVSRGEQTSHRGYRVTKLGEHKCQQEKVV